MVGLGYVIFMLWLEFSVMLFAWCWLDIKGTIAVISVCFLSEFDKAYLSELSLFFLTSLHCLDF